LLTAFFAIVVALTRAAFLKADGRQFEPVPRPHPGIPGYRFPESEDTIVGWTINNNQQDIDLHAWGFGPR
jgi:hypothetical protein